MLLQLVRKSFCECYEQNYVLITNTVISRFPEIFRGAFLLSQNLNIYSVWGVDSKTNYFEFYSYKATG